MEARSEIEVAENRRIRMFVPPPSVDSDDNNSGPNGFNSLPEEIRVHIFKFLPMKDLLNCRLLSPQCKGRVDALFKSRNERVFAVVKYPCKDLIKLFLDLQKYKFDIINGLKLDNNELAESCIKSDCGSHILSSISQPLGIALPWKFIYIHGDWHHSCPAEKMIFDIVSEAQGTLEELEFYSGSTACEVFNNSALRSPTEMSFPKLLRMTMSPFADSNANVKVYRMFQKAAPNLRDINCDTAYTWDLGEDYGDLATKISCVGYYTPRHHRHLKKFVQAEPRALKVLELEEETCENPGNKDLITRLMHWNRTSLETLTWCPYQMADAIDTLRSGFICFPRVTKLCLQVPKWAWALAVLRKINIGQSFPALKEVELVSFCAIHEFELDRQQEQNESSDGKDQEFVSGLVPSNASCLYYDDLPSDQQAPKLRLLGQVFQHVSKMIVEWDLESLDYSELFAAFPNVENLKLYFDDSDAPVHTAAVDAALCGISFEEAESLQQHSDNKTLEFEKLVIVPIRPAVYYLKRLKKLTIGITGMSKGDGVGLSEVSGLLAFSRIAAEKQKIKVSANLRNFADVTRVRPYISQVKFQDVD